MSYESLITAKATHENTQSKRPLPHLQLAQGPRRDRDRVRNVLSRHHKRKHCPNRAHPRERQEPEEEGEEDGEPDTLDWGMRTGGNVVEVRGKREATVSGEGEYLTGAGRELFREEEVRYVRRGLHKG